MFAQNGTYGSRIDAATIATITSVKSMFAFLASALDFAFFSMSEPYSCPPSSGPIGSALNIPTLKLMNHSQNSMLAIGANATPSTLDSYFGAIRSEYGTAPCCIVGGRSSANGFWPNAPLYLSSTVCGSGERTVTPTPRMPLPCSTAEGSVTDFVTALPALSIQMISTVLPRLDLSRLPKSSRALTWWPSTDCITDCGSIPIDSASDPGFTLTTITPNCGAFGLGGSGVRVDTTANRASSETPASIMLLSGPAVSTALFCLSVALFSSSLSILTNAPIGIPRNRTMPVESTRML